MLPEPPDGYYERKYAEPLINAFLQADEEVPADPLLRRADPALVDELVQKTLAQDDPTDLAITGCGELMRFYALEQRAEQLPALLTRNEREHPQFRRSLAATALLGDFGSPDLQRQAAEYCGYLARHYLGPEYFPALVDLLFHLPEDTDEQIVVEPIKNRMTALAPRIESDVDAELEHDGLECLLEDRLPTVLKARKWRQQILQLPDTKHRLRNLGRCYLRFDRSAYVDLHDWAVMMLQRDCQAGDPAQLAEAFAAGFELLMTSATRKGVLSPGDEEDLKIYVTSCARAVDFYHGQLKPPQQEYAQKYDNPEQYDILHWAPEESKEAVGHPVQEAPKQDAGGESGENPEQPSDQKPEEE